MIKRFPLYLPFNFSNYAEAMTSVSSDPTDELLVSALGLSAGALLSMPQKIRQGFFYWHSLKRGRLMPARHDVDPLDLKALLPNVILLDVIHQPADERDQGSLAGLDFRFRLVGTEVAARSARDYTGRRLADIPHMAPGTLFWQHREAVVRCRKPLYSTPSYVGPAKEIRSCHNLLMPLSEDGDRVNMIFCLASFEPTRTGSSDRNTSSGLFPTR